MFSMVHRELSERGDLFGLLNCISKHFANRDMGKTYFIGGHFEIQDGCLNYVIDLFIIIIH